MNKRIILAAAVLLTLGLVSAASAQVIKAGQTKPVVYEKWGFKVQVPYPYEKHPGPRYPGAEISEAYVNEKFAYVVMVVKPSANTLTSTAIEQFIQGKIKSGADPESAKRWELDTKKGDLFKGFSRAAKLEQIEGSEYLANVIGSGTVYEGVSLAPLGDESSAILLVGVIGPKEQSQQVEGRARFLAHSVTRLAGRTTAKPEPKPEAGPEAVAADAPPPAPGEAPAGEGAAAEASEPPPAPPIAGPEAEPPAGQPTTRDGTPIPPAGLNSKRPRPGASTPGAKPPRGLLAAPPKTPTAPPPDANGVGAAEKPTPNPVTKPEVKPTVRKPTVITKKTTTAVAALKLKPRVVKKGEIELVGTVESFEGVANLTMVVDQIRMPNQSPIKLEPPRSKKVLFAKRPAGVNPGLRVVVIGKNLGVGKPITPKVIQPAGAE